MKRLALVAIALVAACGGGDKPANGKADTTSVGRGTTSTDGSNAYLTGAGSSFAYPIYSKWASVYAAKTGVKVNYQSIGSSGGIRQLSDEIVDFGATDGPMTDDQLAKAKGGPILHFPTVLGGVAVTYNLPGVTQPLKLTGAVLADIFLGGVTKWNDSRISALNPGVKLPDTDVIVVHRADGSGTTFIFSDYLSTVSASWLSKVGRGQSLAWPVGLGGKGSEGVTGQVKQSPGAVGYVELSYAKQNNLPAALIQNASGMWIAPTLASVTAAAAGAAGSLPASTDYRISIVNAPGKDAYPISSFTWILIYQHPTDAAKGKALTEFLRWAYTDGEALASSLDYAPLPSAMIKQLQARLDAPPPAR
ncbi:MAG: phosphate ABC transporter substrate-binding protein PstS [Gemmatimonadota bacterium]|nr:phosphate ABC transporter substrate-binding protein PstS [Gemmatimonadota bacterium]